MIVELADLKAHLNLTTDTDDTLLTGKIGAAEAWVAAYIGADLSEDFDDGVPAPILEAIRQLAAHLYETGKRLSSVRRRKSYRSASGLAQPYRQWVF